jgi:hypothetical protein
VVLLAQIADSMIRNVEQISGMKRVQAAKPTVKTIPNINILFKSIAITFIDDFSSCGAPLFNLNLTQLASAVLPSRNHLQFNFTASANYFNKIIEVWEPLIEQSFIELGVEPNHVTVRARLLSVNIAQSFLGTLMELADLARRSEKHSKTLKFQSYLPRQQNLPPAFNLRNSTGERIWFSFDKEGQQRRFLDAWASAALDDLDEKMTNAARIKAARSEKTDNTHSITIGRESDAEPLDFIRMDVCGTFFAGLPGEQLPYSIEYINQSKTLTLHSTVEIENDMDCSVIVEMTTAAGVHQFTIPAWSILDVPLSAATASPLYRYRPSPEFEWSASFDTRQAITTHDVCKGHANNFYTFLAVIKPLESPETLRGSSSRNYSR